MSESRRSYRKAKIAIHIVPAKQIFQFDCFDWIWWKLDYLLEIGLIPNWKPVYIRKSVLLLKTCPDSKIGPKTENIPEKVVQITKKLVQMQQLMRSLKVPWTNNLNGTIGLKREISITELDKPIRLLDAESTIEPSKPIILFEEETTIDQNTPKGALESLE